MNDCDFIYRENAIFELYRYCLEHKVEPEIFMICKNAIKQAKAIDAVTTIRCINCKYASDMQPFTCLCTLSNDRRPLDGFCSEGRGKENEHRNHRQ